MQKLFWLGILLLLSMQLMATHNRAGEITYQQISELTYEVTITTYTATGPGWTADRPELEIYWGDNTSSILPRDEEVFLPDFYKRNVYVGTHTFPGPGIYEIVVEDPNRNLGVENIPNSVQVVFSISTTLQISAELGANSTPILTQPPVDKAAVGQVFIHNPGAFDPDGDSISYKLTTCRGENGAPIEGYTFPEASNSFSIDEVSGDLVWDAPVQVGIYNAAILIEEWRQGVKIGKIIRDMQIEVYDSDDTPPEINISEKLCIEAGTMLDISFDATDAEGDSIYMSANGGPFIVDEERVYFNTYEGAGYATAIFRWNTICEDVRIQPYLVNFKARDNASPVNLADIKNIDIYVIGPATENLAATPTTTSITLTWSPNRCGNVTGYDIYRRIDSLAWEPDSCTTGIPEDLGYTLIGSTESHTDTIFIDNDNGNGLPQGFVYCYRIVARFPDGAESYASEEVCAELVRGIPTITNVSVEETDTETGRIYLAWSKPTDFDTEAAPGPYKYLIYRSQGLWGENLQLIDSTDSINDTVFYDSLLNTRDTAYSYLVEFYNDSPGNRFLIGTPHIASSVFLNIEEQDNSLLLDIQKNVPWINETYCIYRYDEAIPGYDSIGYTDSTAYLDSNLVNGQNYCYYAKSKGAYSAVGYVDPIINYSQENCGTPRDTTPPCPPSLFGQSYCDSLYNQLYWEMADSCYEDTYMYYLYFSPTLEGNMQLLDSVLPRNNMDYIHTPEKNGMAGCYEVTAVDSFRNESLPSNRVCLDACTYYELPNVFTPNGDGHNDYFRPGPYHFVEKVDMKIFNRWGLLVYETQDPDINWDGRHFKNNKTVSDGVYYYICDVYEYRLTGLVPRNITGFIHVINATGAPTQEQE